jgi:lipopolysaccharide biosynthesis glycosyltransferase
VLLQKSDRHRLAYAPGAYNFQDNKLRFAERRAQLSLLKSIRILHYAGTAKPWQETARAGSPTFNLWRAADRDARDRLAALGLVRAGADAPAAS